MTDRTYPLLNRAIQSAYPPGSTYKVVTSLAGLEEQAIDPTTHMPASCVGGYTFGNRFYKCWNHKGHGSLALTAALAQSCDVYYYQLGLRLGVDKLANWAQKIGLGARTGIDLPQERSGLIPTSSYYDRHRGAGKWTKGVTLNIAIGQGEDLATPLQLAMVAATVASRGRVARPHVVEQIVDPVSGAGRGVSPPPKTALHLPEDTWDALSNAMEQVVAAGTGGAAKVPGVRVGGKTGTAQTSNGNDHALFICYAPIEAPTIAKYVVHVLAGAKVNDWMLPSRIGFGLLRTHVPAPSFVLQTDRVPAISTDESPGHIAKGAMYAALKRLVIPPVTNV
jgi:penicillin-binding protein 2